MKLRRPPRAHPLEAPIAPKKRHRSINWWLLLPSLVVVMIVVKESRRLHARQIKGISSIFLALAAHFVLQTLSASVRRHFAP